MPRLEATARGRHAGGPDDVRPYAACLPAVWHLVHADTAAALPSLGRARAFLAAKPAGGYHVSFTSCALAAEALLEQARGAPGRVALGRLDSLLAQGFESVQMGNLIAARIHEARGDRRAALAAARRRASHGRDGPIALTTMLREEGRLAALTGDRAGAIRAYRHFLALRPDPVARLRPDRDRVRAELARLEGAAVWSGSSSPHFSPAGGPARLAVSVVGVDVDARGRSSRWQPPDPATHAGAPGARGGRARRSRGS